MEPRNAVYFPPELIALNQEILLHPDLQRKLTQIAHKEWPEKFAEIAAHCNVVMDDYYTESDIKKLCEILIFRLQNRRAITVQEVKDAPRIILPD